MKFTPLVERWSGFTSFYLLPTCVIGWYGNGGWVYVLWLKGRVGCYWVRK
jgi:hypothetical protein